VPRIKTPRIHTLIFEGEPLDGLTVRVKSIKFGKVRQLIALMEEEDKDVEMMDRITSELADAIVSWDFTEEDGSPVEVSQASIDDLEFDEVMAIVDRWLDAVTGPGKELGKDSSSGATFPGRPLTMEAL
jgi:hypothetical protein